MIYGLRHRTTYNYESSVTFARCVLRLTPQSSAVQTVLRSSISVTPRPSSRIERIGPFGEQTLTVVVDRPHEALIIDATSRVDLHAPSPPALDAGEPWEAVRRQAYETTDLGPQGPATYLYPTRRTPVAPAITEYARRSFPAGRCIVAATAELMGRIRSEFTYDPKATEVSTPVAEAFEARHGVCQDFAHIMIAGLRGIGLPAAYVSGYLRTIPPAGKPRLEGADATHAWVSLWCGEALAWVGFDPTNNLLAANDHIVLAVGRDYSDVAPVDGIILAPGAQTLKVEVDVVPEVEREPSLSRTAGARSTP